MDIPFGVTPTSLSSYELQRIVIKAIELDVRWKMPNTPISKVTHVISESREYYVDMMQLLPGGRYLVTTQRKGGSTRTHLALWSLEDARHTYRIASFDIAARICSFHACLKDDGEEIYVVVAADLSPTLCVLLPCTEDHIHVLILSAAYSKYMPFCYGIRSLR